jgi:hypothetical protein
VWGERESRIERVESRLDEFLPIWQFGEFHAMEIAASPARAYEAMKGVTAGEIFLFNTLTWIRRGGRRSPESILNAGSKDPLIDVATRSGFVRLADDSPREFVMGILLAKPAASTAACTAALFREALPPDCTIGAVNFLVTPTSSGGSIVSTETRVFANSRRRRRAFGRYWLVIYPGSALIRLMWLRAIKRRAMKEVDPLTAT